MNKDFAFAFHKNAVNVIALSAETWNGFSSKELDLNPNVNQITKGY